MTYPLAKSKYFLLAQDRGRFDDQELRDELYVMFGRVLAQQAVRTYVPRWRHYRSRFDDEKPTPDGVGFLPCSRRLLCASLANEKCSEEFYLL